MPHPHDAPFIQLRTAVPGPRSQAILQRRAQAVPRGVPAVSPIAIDHAQGAVLIDADGNHLLDFAGGIGTLNLGHCHPAVVAAASAQLGRLTHACFAVSSYEPYVALAERMNALTPGQHDKRTFFVNSGAEAVENAVKIARRFTSRQAILCFEHAFHGRTQLALSLTGKVSPYKRGFGPFAPEIYRIPYPYCYRCDRPRPPGDDDDAGCCLASPAEIERLLLNQVDPGSIAAIVIELQLGEGGFVPAPPAFITALRDFARTHGILLVADEIQTGLGRTGKLFACEHHGLIPDLLLCAKSLAGGLPLASITGRADVMESAQIGGLGGTFGGNPVACAAALAALETLIAEDLPARAATIGARARARLQSFADRQPFCGIGDVRGLGAMLALELVTDRTTRAPDRARTERVLHEALRRGLLLLQAGTLGNVIRLLMPLNIPDAALEEGLHVLGEALAQAAEARP